MELTYEEYLHKEIVLELIRLQMQPDQRYGIWHRPYNNFYESNPVMLADLLVDRKRIDLDQFLRLTGQPPVSTWMLSVSA